MFTALLVFAVVLTADLQRRHESVIRKAITKSGQTMLQASQEAEIGQGQFTRQIQMLEGSLKRLAMQPQAFWQWWAVEIVNEFGLPQELHVARQLDAVTEMERAS